MKAFIVVRLRTLFVLLSIAVGASGCAASLPRPISGVVRELGGPDCPEERIVVVDSRVVDHDTVYVLDACGTAIELERGLARPSRWSGKTSHGGASLVESA